MESLLPKVLIAEDNEQARELLHIALTPAGYEVHAARDGFEALRLMGEVPCDVVLTDYHMPRMDGLRLLQVVKAWWPQVPVVFVSGERLGAASRAIEQGAYAWISKPWDRAKLLETLHAAVQAAVAMRESNLTEGARHDGDGEPHGTGVAPTGGCNAKPCEVPRLFDNGFPRLE